MCCRCAVFWEFFFNYFNFLCSCCAHGSRGSEQTVLHLRYRKKINIKSFAVLKATSILQQGLFFFSCKTGISLGLSVEPKKNNVKNYLLIMSLLNISWYSVLCNTEAMGCKVSLCICKARLE